MKELRTSISFRAALSIVIRVPLMILLCSAVFVYEYLVVRDSDRVELGSDSLSVQAMVAGMLGGFALFTIADKTGVSGAYTFSWAQIHRLAGVARRNFPNLISLSILETLKVVEERLPFALGLPLILPAVLLYQALVPWLQQQLWSPLFRKIVPTAYLLINSRMYQELNRAEPTIRLLRLLPGQAQEPVRCQLFVANVYHADFEAVSYTWGGHLVLRKRISVNGENFWLTHNIVRALHHLRETAVPRTLWIDQICINQHDEAEKTDQVTHKMHHVYRNAKRVIVWLGASTADTPWAFEQAKFHPEARYDAASGYEIKKGRRESEEARRYIDTWMNIFWRRWFRRVWVVQEVALARHIMVKCGDSEMDWGTLTSTAQTLKRIHKVSANPHSRALLSYVDGSNTDTRESSGLLELAIRFRNYEASDARDKLIGFLALADDGQQYSGLDYCHTSGALFANFTAAYIERSQSLGILALAETRNEPFLEAAPCSWALNWGRHDMFKGAPAVIWGIGLEYSAITQTAKYSACANRPASSRREPGSSREQSIRGIFLRGWYADTVKSVSTVGAEYDMLTTLPIWEEFARRQMPANKDIDAMFENIIVAEMCHLQQGKPWFEWYTKQYKANDKEPVSQPQTEKEASGIVEALCHERRLFVTVGGRLGIGPSATSVGDHICILEGSAVPCIIRKWRNVVRLMSAGYLTERQFDYSQPHHFVGQTVISGMMYATNGEIEAQIEAGEIQPREIWLR